MLHWTEDMVADVWIGITGWNVYRGSKCNISNIMYYCELWSTWCCEYCSSSSKCSTRPCTRCTFSIAAVYFCLKMAAVSFCSWACKLAPLSCSWRSSVSTSCFFSFPLNVSTWKQTQGNEAQIFRRINLCAYILKRRPASWLPSCIL